MTARGYVPANVGSHPEPWRTDYTTDPDAEHDSWRDPEDDIPTDWDPYQ